MLTQKYDFVSGIETASPPSSGAPSAVGDVVALGATTTFTIANSTGPSNITGMVFNKTSYRAFFITYSIFRSAAGGLTRAQAGTLICITDGTNWEIGDQPVSVPSSDDAGVDFTITSAGQVQYTSDDNTGSYSAANSILKWELFQLIGV